MYTIISSIKIDAKEKSRVKTGLDFYKEFNVSVENLPVGDYLFNDKVVFEYKTTKDFISSIKKGNVFNQAINQFESFPFHYVVIEVDDNKLQKALKAEYRRRSYFSRKNWNGAVNCLNSFTNVIMASTEKKCFQLMLDQARFCLDGKYLVKKFPKSTGSSAFKHLCYCVDSVGDKRAELITEELGLSTLEDLLGIGYDDLVRINGIGDKTARSILDELKG